MRINRELSQKREAYVYQCFKHVPPMPVADVQANLANPKNEFGGMKMSENRINEIRKLALGDTPLPQKVYTRRTKRQSGEATPTPEPLTPEPGTVFADPDQPVKLLAKAPGGKTFSVGTAPLRMLRWLGKGLGIGNGNDNSK